MKLQLWMLEIKPGHENTMADALSRQEWSGAADESGISSGAGGALRSFFGAGGCEGQALTEKVEEKVEAKEEEEREKEGRSQGMDKHTRIINILRRGSTH